MAARTLFVTLLLLQQMAFANLEVPADDRVLQRYGEPSAITLPSQFRLTVWNVYKAGYGENWSRDFRHLSRDSDLLLVQEGWLTGLYRQTLEKTSGFLWLFASAFNWYGAETGVMTGSKAPILNSRWMRSPGREPVTETPKMALATIVPLEDGRELLAINIHALNFNLVGAYKEQIQPIFDLIKKHESGPVIFAGDFNTWMPSRSKFLREQARAAGLTAVTFTDDRRALALDHVFVRHLKPRSAAVLTNIRSSDHRPLRVDFDLQ